MNFSRLIVLIILLAAAFPTVAQDIDLSETFTFDSGTTFSFPEGGEVGIDENNSDFMNVAFDDSIFYVAAFPIFEGQDFSAASELIDAAEWYIETISETDFDADAAETIELNGREALNYPYTYEDEDWRLVLVRFDDGTFAGVDAGGADEDTVLAIATSLRAAEVEAAGSATDCTVVSAAEAGTAQLRVGPGENRTSFAFLPANIEFTPLGQAEADDGSLWFQLDRAEVAPQSAAAEAWVAAEAVETSGDCDNLDEASAPPLVPIVPAAPPSSSGGNNSSSGGGQSGSTGGIVPAGGTWTISYGNRAKGSCLDAAGSTYEFGVNWQPDVVSVSFNNSGLILDGNRFSQLASGAYSGVFTLSNGNSLQLILFPVSPTQFSGEALLTGVVEGHTCSNTVPATMTKN